MHRYLLHNDEIRDTGQPLISPGQVGFMNGWGVFSTLRVSEGVLFAYERHYRRMLHDAELLRVPFPFSADDLRRALLSLVEANHALNATLRLAVVRNRGGLFEGPGIVHDADLIAFTAPLTDWGSGVKLGYMPHARYGDSPFAGTKVCSWAQNVSWYEEAHERGLDEFVLLNEHEQISECTSANIFAIEGDCVWTPPLGTSGCLPGVTRAILLEEIYLQGIKIAERELTPSILEQSDQVFITSSTRDLVPVLEIDREPLNQCPDLFGQLRNAFLQYRAKYVASYAARNEIFAA